MVPKSTANCDSFSHLAVELDIQTVIDGAFAAVPEVVELKTVASSRLSGSFDLSVGFNGDYTSYLTSDAGGVTGTVTAGSKRVRMSKMSQRSSGAATPKIGGELHKVDKTGTFNRYWLPLDSYHKRWLSRLPTLRE